MDTSGLRMPALPRFADRRRWRRLPLAAALVIGLLAGCASGPAELGRPLPVDRLAQLTPRASTMADVLRTLGEPQGRGAGRAPLMPLHDLLLYESDVMDGTTMRMKMLIVFVHRGTGLYEGYMWFQSGQVLSPVS